ncbi:MAG: hypothetical protein ABJB97_07940 [Acidobacteriota bacterium]
MNEVWWKSLMDKIRDNNVVPIIGSLVAGRTAGLASSQAQIAARLMHDSGVHAGRYAPTFPRIKRGSLTVEEERWPA